MIKSKIFWLSKIDRVKNLPSIFIANEFFDALAIRQFEKKNNFWFEKFVNVENKNKAFFFEKKINIKKIEKKIKFNISYGQNFIEYSEHGFNYLKNISNIIKKNKGGLLLVDYGYNEKKMKNSLQGVSNHKFANILNNIGKVDITHNISFNLFKQFAEQFENLDTIITNQKKFLTNMGILQRAEIVSKNMVFSKKTDLFYRIKRLIDKKQMGELFKVMLIKNKKNKFNIGFKN